MRKRRRIEVTAFRRTTTVYQSVPDLTGPPGPAQEEVINDDQQRSTEIAASPEAARLSEPLIHSASLGATRRAGARGGDFHLMVRTLKRSLKRLKIRLKRLAALRLAA